MGKVLLGVVAALASLMLVDSLNCNTCPFGLAGFCFFGSSQQCPTNTTSCFTSTATFPGLNFKGFTVSGCTTNTLACNTTSNSTLLSFTYNTAVSCCSSTNCNAANAAPTTRMTLSAVIGVAAIASLWGSML